LPVNIEGIIKSISEAKNKAKKRNFLESIDIAINLKGIDFKKPNTKIDSELTLPHQLTKEPKICVIGSGDLIVKAKSAGVDLVLEKSDLEKLGANKKEARKIANEIDFFIASADMMPLVGRYLGPVLGPRNKMPKPGTGIIPPTADLTPIIERLKKTVRLVAKKDPVIHVKVGDREMDDKSIAENIKAVLNFLEGKLEKGFGNIKSVYVKTTMGPAVKVEY